MTATEPNKTRRRKRMKIEECQKCEKHGVIEGLHVKCRFEEEKGAWGKSGYYLITNMKGNQVVKCPKE